jgi:hypothetical protein
MRDSLACDHFDSEARSDGRASSREKRCDEDMGGIMRGEFEKRMYDYPGAVTFIVDGNCPRVMISESAWNVFSDEV